MVFGGSFENSITNASLSGDSGTLTIGSGITIDGTSGLIGSPGLPLVNQGTIDASESGDGIGVQGLNWTNSGTLEATNGGSLGLYGTWSSSGSITATGAASQAILAGTSSDTGSINASSSAQVFFRGTATLTGTTTFDGSGGTVTFEGTLDESGNTVTLDDPGISYVLAGGTIDAGTVATTDGATSWSQTTMAAPFRRRDLRWHPRHGNRLRGQCHRHRRLHVQRRDRYRRCRQLDIRDAELRRRPDLERHGLGGLRRQCRKRDQHRLERRRFRHAYHRPGITIEGESGSIGYNNGGPDTPLVIQGVVDADTSGASIQIYGTNWTSSGTIAATNGGTINLETAPSNFTPGLLTGGTWDVGANSTLNFPGGNIATDAATIILGGPVQASRSCRRSVHRAGGSLELSDGALFSTTTNLLDQGTINVADPGILNINGNFTLAAGGQLDVESGLQSGQRIQPAQCHRPAHPERSTGRHPAWWIHTRPRQQLPDHQLWLGHRQLCDGIRA